MDLDNIVHDVQLTDLLWLQAKVLMYLSEQPQCNDDLISQPCVKCEFKLFLKWIPSHENKQFNMSVCL